MAHQNSPLSASRAALCAALALALAGCGAPIAPRETTLTSSLSAQPDASAPAPVDYGGPAAECSSDKDCGSRALCIAHVCQIACTSSEECAAGSTCNFQNGDELCWRMPGCNPPPPGTACPMMCWGFCDAHDG